MSSGETENKKMKTQYLYHKASNFVLKWDNLSVTYGAYLMSLVAVVKALRIHLDKSKQKNYDSKIYKNRN